MFALNVNQFDTRVSCFETLTLGQLLQTAFAVIRILAFGPRQAKKLPSNMREMRRFKSSYACAKYHPVLWSPFIHSVVTNDSISGQGRP